MAERSVGAPSASVHEPEMDMDRAAQTAAPAVETWYRRFAAALLLARPEGIIRRPRRAIDRERQEFPSLRD